MKIEGKIMASNVDKLKKEIEALNLMEIDRLESESESESEGSMLEYSELEDSSIEDFRSEEPASESEEDDPQHLDRLSVSLHKALQQLIKGNKEDKRNSHSNVHAMFAVRNKIEGQEDGYSESGVKRKNRDLNIIEMDAIGESQPSKRLCYTNRG